MTTAKILLTDDLRASFESERSFLQRPGCELLAASSGPEALRVAREQRPDIILLDYDMAGISGLEVCLKLKEDPSTRDIPVLMVASRTDAQAIAGWEKAGCADLLFRPVTGKLLMDKVTAVLKLPYRAHLRTRVSIEVSLGLTGDAVSMQGYSEDISEGGMMVETLEPIETGTRVRIEFTIPSTGEKVGTSAEVIRVTSQRSRGTYGVALQFAHRLEITFQDAVRHLLRQEGGA